MLTRREIAAKSAEFPVHYRFTKHELGDIRKWLNDEVSEQQSEDTLRQRLCQAAVLHWMCSHQEEEYVLSRFMKTLGFVWADVRELKQASYNSAIVSCREKLLDDEGVDDSDEVRTAMQLMEHWLTKAEQEHGDCLDEFFYTQMILQRTFGDDRKMGELLTLIAKRRELCLYLMANGSLAMLFSCYFIVMPCWANLVILAAAVVSNIYTLVLILRNMSRQRRLTREIFDV